MKKLSTQSDDSAIHSFNVSKTTSIIEMSPSDYSEDDDKLTKEKTRTSNTTFIEHQSFVCFEPKKTTSTDIPKSTQSNDGDIFSHCQPTKVLPSRYTPIVETEKQEDCFLSSVTSVSVKADHLPTVGDTDKAIKITGDMITETKLTNTHDITQTSEINEPDEDCVSIDDKNNFTYSPLSSDSEESDTLSQPVNEHFSEYYDDNESSELEEKETTRETLPKDDVSNIYAATPCISDVDNTIMDDTAIREPVEHNTTRLGTEIDLDSHVTSDMKEREDSEKDRNDTSNHEPNKKQMKTIYKYIDRDGDVERRFAFTLEKYSNCLIQPERNNSILGLLLDTFKEDDIVILAETDDLIL